MKRWVYGTGILALASLPFLYHSPTSNSLPNPAVPLRRPVVSPPLSLGVPSAFVSQSPETFMRELTAARDPLISVHSSNREYVSTLFSSLRQFNQGVMVTMDSEGTPCCLESCLDNMTSLRNCALASSPGGRVMLYSPETGKTFMYLDIEVSPSYTQDKDGVEIVSAVHLEYRVQELDPESLTFQDVGTAGAVFSRRD